MSEAEKPGCDCVSCRISAQIAAVIAAAPEASIPTVLIALATQIVRVAVDRSSSMDEADQHAQAISQGIVVNTAISSIKRFGAQIAASAQADQQIGTPKGTA